MTQISSSSREDQCSTRCAEQETYSKEIEQNELLMEMQIIEMKVILPRMTTQLMKIQLQSYLIGQIKQVQIGDEKFQMLKNKIEVRDYR